MSPVSLALATSLLAAAGAPLEPLAVNRHVDRGQVKLGEPFVYELSITHPSDQRYELQLSPEYGDFEVLEQTRERVDGADSATTTFKVKLALFALGSHALPDLPFDVVSTAGTARWTAPGVDVVGVPTLPPDAEKTGADLLDIHPPTDVPVPSYRLLYALLAALGLLALCWVLYRWWKRPRAAKVRPAAPALPLDVRTRGLLDSLRSEGLPGQGRFQEFHFRLSEILRGYLGERFGFVALESTTHELIEALHRLHTPGLKIDELRRFCEASDLVKFAKAASDPDLCKDALEYGYRLVYETTPSPHGNPVRAP